MTWWGGRSAFSLSQRILVAGQEVSNHSYLLLVHLLKAKYEKEEEKLDGEVQKSRNTMTKYQTELGMKKDQMVSHVTLSFQCNT